MATAAAWLLASLNDRFSVFRITVSGRRSAQAPSSSIDPSPDALSTTMTSNVR